MRSVIGITIAVSVAVLLVGILLSLYFGYLLLFFVLPIGFGWSLARRRNDARSSGHAVRAATARGEKLLRR
jgi:hypothetical protein